MTERIIFQNQHAVDIRQRQAGKLEEWQEHVAQYAVGNSRLLLALSAAFAAPLIYPCDTESGGFHFRGASSTGKSTALVVAGSVWGGGGVQGYVRTWRATANGMEGIAAVHCDSLLCLDEISQVDARDAGAAAYMLANGSGKVRATRNGDARPPMEWRLLFLSSGEISLADKIAEDGRGRRVAAGQQVRIIDLAADAGAGLGLFENLHGFGSADAFARHLKSASRQYYGRACRKFTVQLQSNFAAIAPTAKGYMDEFVAENCPAGADGQVTRVATRFGLVAAGGEMAAACGVVPWPTGQAAKGVTTCFRDWLSARGGTEAHEDKQALSAVQRFIELHGASRFEAMGELW